MKKIRLLNTSEHLTEQILRRGLEGSGFRVFAQLALNKVIQPDQGEPISKPDRQFLASAELDFVVYNSESVPQFAVEFDGPLHQRDDRRRSDIRKNRICQRASLPLLRISDVHIERDDKLSLLEFIVERFVFWHIESDEILAEIREHLSYATTDEISELTEGGFADPSIDPQFIFDLRHPFPGTMELAQTLYARFGIVSHHMDSQDWDREIRKLCVLDFGYVGGSSGSSQHDIIQTRSYQLIRRTQTENGPVVTELHRFEVTHSIQWTLPVVEDYRFDEAPIYYALRTGNLPIAFQEIPGISMPELCEHLCDHIALKRLSEWADQSLPKSE